MKKLILILAIATTAVISCQKEKTLISSGTNSEVKSITKNETSDNNTNIASKQVGSKGCVNLDACATCPACDPGEECCSEVNIPAPKNSSFRTAVINNNGPSYLTNNPDLVSGLSNGNSEILNLLNSVMNGIDNIKYVSMPNSPNRSAYLIGNTNNMPVTAKKGTIVTNF